MNTAENQGTILIVDDDPSVLILVQNILTSAGYRVLPALDRADAVRLAGQKHIHMDMALLDVYMPGVSGTELADEIMSIRPNLRILWMSGFVEDEFIRIKLIAGYSGFLSKPLRRDGLLLAVEQAMAAAPHGSAAPDHPRKTASAAGGGGQSS
jgi:two-component system cell cycle sensor histidine kinase/response regulator CckA